MIWIGHVFFWVLAMLSVSFLYYGLGRLLFWLGFRESGFNMVAMSIAVDFGFDKGTRKWLVENCPYGKSHCAECRLWTCDGVEF